MDRQKVGGCRSNLKGARQVKYVQYRYQIDDHVMRKPTNLLFFYKTLSDVYVFYCIKAHLFTYSNDNDYRYWYNF